MFNVKFKIKDGRNTTPPPRSSSRSSHRSSSPFGSRSSRSHSAERTRITKISKNGQTITTVVDGRVSHGKPKIIKTKN